VSNLDKMRALLQEAGISFEEEKVGQDVEIRVAQEQDLHVVMTFNDSRLRSMRAWE
jgi:hypothetical protein